MFDAPLAIVRYSLLRSRVAILIWILLAVAAAAYFFSFFAIDTDVNDLISRDLPWRKRELAYQAAFPQGKKTTLAVIDAPTAEEASAASHALATALTGAPTLFQSVQEVGGGAFFEKNRFMFMPLVDVERVMSRLTGAKSIIAFLVSDQTLRGLAKTLVYVLHGLQVEGYSLDDIDQSLNAASAVLETAERSQQTAFSWARMLQSSTEPSGRQRLISIQPKLFTKEFEPGKRAGDAIRKAAAELNLQDRFRARIRLTGPVPLVDEQFASIRENSSVNGAITAGIVIAALWAALLSWRLVAAVLVTLTVGLLVTAGLGLLVVGALNPISMAFAMLFVGLGADFAVQYTVRYRAQRHETPELTNSLIGATKYVATPLTLAAVSAAVGFLSFWPTDYIGLAQLGVIAGIDMVVAYASTFTLLPALIENFKPPMERHAIGQPWLGPIDRLLSRRREVIIGSTAVLVTGGAFFLPYLHFDANALHLQRKSEEAVATFLELSDNPAIDVNSAQVIAPAESDVQSIAAKIATIPEVSETRTIFSFIPSEQKEKLEAIRNAKDELGPALSSKMRPPPTEQETIQALETARGELETAGAREKGYGAAAARRLAGAINHLINADASIREHAARAFLTPLKQDLDSMRLSLQPTLVTIDVLPEAFLRAWVAEDGRHRIDVLPKGDPNNGANIRDFALAVLAVEPTATGQAVGILMWSRTMIKALVEAASIAFGAVAIVLWIPLRRIGDVLLTLIPLIVAATATLEICAMSGFKLNYANIIAFPALIGVGVAFKIYYIVAWRRGETQFLQSPLTRAVFYSAVLTATAFGSLAFSSNPGISSMGKLLALSLACTLTSAVLFQPALMGKPRDRDADLPD